MAIPGSYPYPTSTPPPDAGGGTPTTPPPPQTGGGWGAGWLHDLLLRLVGGDASKLPPWLQNLPGNWAGRYGGEAGVGGWPTGDAATGWWGNADDLAKIKAMIGTPPDLRAKHAHYDSTGKWVPGYAPWSAANAIPGNTWDTPPPEDTTDWSAHWRNWASGRGGAPALPSAGNTPGTVTGQPIGSDQTAQLAAAMGRLNRGDFVPNPNYTTGLQPATVPASVANPVTGLGAAGSTAPGGGAVAAASRGTAALNARPSASNGVSWLQSWLRGA